MRESDANLRDKIATVLCAEYSHTLWYTRVFLYTLTNRHFVRHFARNTMSYGVILFQLYYDTKECAFTGICGVIQRRRDRHTFNKFISRRGLLGQKEKQFAHAGFRFRIHSQ